MIRDIPLLQSYKQQVARNWNNNNGMKVVTTHMLLPSEGRLGDVGASAPIIILLFTILCTRSLKKIGVLDGKSEVVQP